MTDPFCPQPRPAPLTTSSHGMAAARYLPRKDGLRGPCGERIPPCPYGDDVLPLRLPDDEERRTRRPSFLASRGIDAIHPADRATNPRNNFFAVGPADGPEGCPNGLTASPRSFTSGKRSGHASSPSGQRGTLRGKGPHRQLSGSAGGSSAR